MALMAVWHCSSTRRPSAVRDTIRLRRSPGRAGYQAALLEPVEVVDQAGLVAAGGGGQAGLGGGVAAAERVEDDVVPHRQAGPVQQWLLAAHYLLEQS
jgi:hypothetical protein